MSGSVPNAGTPKPSEPAAKAPSTKMARLVSVLGPTGDDFITRAWTGRERLWKVYWVYGALAGVGLLLVPPCYWRWGCHGS